MSAASAALPYRSAVRLSPPARQFLTILAVFAACGALAWVAPAGVARLIFMACGLAVAQYWRRRSPWLYITATLWFWTFTPLMRRLIDFHAGFDPTDVVLETPNLMAALMLPDIVRDQSVFRRREGMLGLLVLLPIAYGLSVSWVSGQLFAGAVAAMDWIVPVFYYFYILVHAERIRESENCVGTFLMLNGLLVVGYGVWQAAAPQPWDIAWVVASGLDGSARHIATAGFGLFGSLNSSEILAFWLSALIVLSGHFRTRLSLLVLPAAGVLLLLTAVRSVAAATLGCLVLAALLGQRRVWQALATLAVVGAVAFLALSSIDTALADRIADRFGTVDLQTDDSALVRAAIWADTPALVDAHPFGLGIGAIGRGAVVSSDANLVSVDFGPLAIYLSLGWVAGSMYLLGICAMVAQAMAAAWRSRSPPALAFAVLAVGLAAQLSIVNIIGFAGMLLWTSAGFAVALGAPAPRADLRPVQKWPA